jgi:hypothetical protein
MPAAAAADTKIKARLRQAVDLAAEAMAQGQTLLPRWAPQTLVAVVVVVAHLARRAAPVSLSCAI